MSYVIKPGGVFTDDFGRSVRIIATDIKNKRAVVGLVTMSDGRELLEMYDDGGKTAGSTGHLVLPRFYVALDDVISMVRHRLDPDALREMLIQDLETLPTREPA